MISVGLGMAAGGCINCPEGPDTMQPDLREIGPSFFFGPPPLWERLKTSVYIRIEDASPIKRAAFHYFMDTAAKVGKDIMEKIFKMMCWIGGWGCESAFSPTPEPGNRFRLRLRLRCVRACVRSCVSARESPSVARGRRANLWVVRRPSSVRPGGHLDEKFEQ